VEIVRQALDAYARRDIEAMRRLNSADVVLDWSASHGWLAGVYRGWDEVMRFYADYFDIFESIRIEAEAYMPAGDSVVVPNIAYQRGRDGIEVTARGTFVFRLREGKLRTIRLYQDLPEALKAVGLEE